MNQLLSYLMTQLTKKTCPIVCIDRVFDVGFNSPWREYVVIKFEDGSIIELMEKPKHEYPNKNPTS